MSPDYGLNVAEAFQRYLQTGDNSTIEKYSSKELKAAISRLSPFYDNNKQWYREIERRILELQRIEDRKQFRVNILKELTFDRAIAFVLGLLLGMQL